MDASSKFEAPSGIFPIEPFLDALREQLLKRGPDTLQGYWSFIRGKSAESCDIMEIETNFRDIPSKFAQFAQVRALAREVQPDVIIFVTETWTVSVEKGEEVPKGSIEHHEQRLDAVMVSVETKDHFNNYCIHWDKDKVLSQWVSHGKDNIGGDGAGRGFWPRPPQAIFDEIEPLCIGLTLYREMMLEHFRATKTVPTLETMGGAGCPEMYQRGVHVMMRIIGIPKWSLWLEAAVAWVIEKMAETAA